MENAHIIFGTLSLLLMLFSASLVQGHGRLIEPAARSSLWRYDYPGAEVEYDDNGLNCGGFNNQHSAQNGKCGICGDPFQGPRLHEAGGKYAKGIIARRYTEGDVIDVAVEITANHKGWFEFRVCPNNDVNKPATQSCLDNYLLQLADSSGTRYSIGPNNEIMRLKLKLPTGLTCTQCVFQWKYHAGNSWGTDPITNRGCVGCGAQEEFYGCSDIMIQPKDDNKVEPITSKVTPSTAQPNAGTVSNNPKTVTTTPASITPSSITSSTKSSTTSSTTAEAATTATTKQGTLVCSSTGAYVKTPGMDVWCETNCAAGFCPPTHCKCQVQPSKNKPGCRPVGIWNSIPGMTSWCKNNCAAGYCPRNYCRC